MNERRLRYMTVTYLGILLLIGLYAIFGDRLGGGDDPQETHWVKLDAGTVGDLAWAFYPAQVTVPAQPEEPTHVLYRVENLSDRRITAQARYSIEPSERKGEIEIVQCFCYEPETLEPGEIKYAPITFRIREDAPTDAGSLKIFVEFRELPDETGIPVQALRSEREGTLEVRVIDDREAIADFEMVGVQFSAVGIHHRGEPWHEGWELYEATDAMVDLTRHVGVPSDAVFSRSVPAGSYDGVKLRINQVSGLLVGAKTVRRVPFSDSPVSLDFEIEEGKRAILTFDFGVFDRSDHPGETYRVIVKRLLSRLED